MHSSSKPRDDLQTPIQYIKGVGPKRARRFAERGVLTVADALFLLPRGYEDRRKVSTISTLADGEWASFTARVVDFGVRHISRSRRMFELLLDDETGKIRCRWFNFNPATFSKRFKRGEHVRVAGHVKAYRGSLGLVHPDIEKASSSSDTAGEDFGAIVPVYPEVEGVYSKVVRQIMRRVVKRFADKVDDCLPDEIRDKHGLPGVQRALEMVHFPGPDDDLEALERGQSDGHRRLVFEEFFLLQLGLAIRRARFKNDRGRPIEPADDLEDLARDLFGFELTGGQKRVLAEIIADMSAERPMNRLLQGDVGSGKTAVAILAAIAAARSGAQTALMAPTEILAEQHYRQVVKLLAPGVASKSVPRPAFLASSVKGAERRSVIDGVASGEMKLLVGTHALIEEQVEFDSLGLCIIDEQHRFGVLQRARLKDKGPAGPVPDVLVMTATPIPRTLSMTVYGDLDVSILDEMPPGRTPVRTVVLGGKEVRRAYEHVRREAGRGGRAYLVYPLVEESEKIELLDASRMFEKLREGAFASLRLGLLHGRMAAAEKEKVMTEFEAGRLDVLVSTTVIEVGVDVPAATVMVVEHAERFGLSQLHQLRGRVGRGERPGTCFLVAHSMSSQDARARLRVMERTNDGFHIAEEDLAIRGPGEFLGTRQSGLPAFAFGNLTRDSDILLAAREDAFGLIGDDPRLSKPEYRSLRRALEVRWGHKLALAEVG